MVSAQTLADPEGAATRESQPLLSSQLKGELLLEMRFEQGLHGCHTHYETLLF